VRSAGETGDLGLKLRLAYLWDSLNSHDGTRQTRCGQAAAPARSAPAFIPKSGRLVTQSISFDQIVALRNLIAKNRVIPGF